jgi:uncharacterized membrane-anchored protein
MFMTKKSRQALPWIVGLFVGGIVIAGIGLTKGQELAAYFSRPMGAEFWFTSEGMQAGWTYIPVMVGVSMIVLAMVFVTVLFIQWLKEPVTTEAGTGSAQAAE